MGRDFTPETILSASGEEIKIAVNCRDLKQVSGAWRLPRWPSASRARRLIGPAWRKWATMARLGDRPTQAVQGAIESKKTALGKPAEPPLTWASLEADMEIVRGDQGSNNDTVIILRDDKDCGIVWCCESLTADTLVIQNLLADKMWQPSELDTTTLQKLIYTLCVVGLPQHMRRATTTISNIRTPRLYISIKGKCFAPDGQKLCRKEGHSCCQRITSTSRMPYKRAWNLIGRAIEAMIMATGGSAEIFGLRDIADCIRDSLPKHDIGTGKCDGCGRKMEKYTLQVVDIDQAYEQCTPPSVLTAFDCPAREFERLHGTTFIRIPKNKHEKARVGKGPMNAIATGISCCELKHALFVALNFTSVTYGTIIWSHGGLAIGGVISTVALSVRL